MVCHSPLATTDSQLASRVRNQLHRRIELRRVEVRENRGSVYLHGRVSSYFLKQLCISGSQRVAGVHQVFDAIEVAQTKTQQVA